MAITYPPSTLRTVALTIFGEARGSGIRGTIAVANVIANRAASPGWWGNDPESVCLARDQFSCWLPGPDRDAMLAADWMTAGYAESFAIAAAMLNMPGFPELPRLVDDATSYYATTMRDPPRWAAGMVFVREIGGQRFYELPAPGA